MAQPVLVDGRNFFNPEEVRRAGFDYSGIGRPARHRPRSAPRVEAKTNGMAPRVSI
jgi:UDPglucose 6-dehydrogenase